MVTKIVWMGPASGPEYAKGTTRFGRYQALRLSASLFRVGNGDATRDRLFHRISTVRNYFFHIRKKRLIPAKCGL